MQDAEEDFADYVPRKGPVMETVDHMVFDTERICPGGADAFFLANGLQQYSNSLGRNKLPADTNMAMSGCLPMPKQLTVDRLDAYFKVADLDTMDALEGGMFTLICGSKSYGDIKVAHMASLHLQGGADLPDWAAKYIAERQHSALALSVRAARRYMFAVPVVVPPLQVLGIRFSLSSYLYREVEITVGIGPRMAREIC